MPDDQPKPDDESEVETSQEGASEGGEEGGSDQPDIAPDEQASIPEGLDDIDPEEAEEAAGVDEEDVEDEQAGADSDIADPGASGGEATEASPLKAGNLYVSVVQSVTNAQIEKFGDEDAEELGDDHFEQYDLAHHFNETMDYMGVGSDMEPHEALLMATVLSVGDGLVSETDVLDKQVSRLMDKAMNGDGAENGGVAA
ncbi:hypothetical protein [Halolamina salina]|uniref:Uncharacterized protein n=1 Tax=Halolamina salina TaxID=1220023 RepID=A0ABD6B975_9EURY